MLNPYAKYAETLFSETFCKAVNTAAENNQQVRSALGELESKTLLFELSNFKYSFALVVTDGIVMQAELPKDDADLVVSGTLDSFLKVFAKGEFDPAMMEGIDLKGDMQLAQRLYRIFQNTQFDWEEEISRFTGDIAARRIGNVMKWGSQNLMGKNSSLAEKVKNTLVNETYILPTRPRVRKFMDDVDTLQADMERLTKRIDRLEDQ